jgi:hypothetical protein
MGVDRCDCRQQDDDKRYAQQHDEDPTCSEAAEVFAKGYG